MDIRVRALLSEIIQITQMFISMTLMSRTKLIVLQHFWNKERRRNLRLNSQPSLISYPSSQKSSLEIQTA